MGSLCVCSILIKKYEHEIIIHFEFILYTPCLAFGLPLAGGLDPIRPRRELFARRGG